MIACSSPVDSQSWLFRYPCFRSSRLWNFVISFQKLSRRRRSSISGSFSKSNVTWSGADTSLQRSGLNHSLCKASAADMRPEGLNGNILLRRCMALEWTPGKCKPLHSRAAKERMYLLAASLSSWSMPIGSGVPKTLKIMLSWSCSGTSCGIENSSRWSGDKGKHEDPGNSGPRSSIRVPCRIPKSPAKMQPTDHHIHTLTHTLMLPYELSRAGSSAAGQPALRIGHGIGTMKHHRQGADRRNSLGLVPKIHQAGSCC